jgi:hypothetical protein
MVDEHLGTDLEIYLRVGVHYYCRLRGASEGCALQSAGLPPASDTQTASKPESPVSQHAARPSPELQPSRGGGSKRSGQLESSS